MIGVAQNDLRAQLFQNVLRDGLHRARGAARHEGRRFDHAVNGLDVAEARRAGLGFNCEGQWHEQYGTSSVSSRAKRGIPTIRGTEMPLYFAYLSAILAG